jgi:tetratricopeptide (TPR) repeat protein
VRQIDEALAVIKDCEPTIDILAVRAECYETNGQVEPALECTGQALALDPDHHRANVIQGRILVAQKDVENALKSLERAVKRDPADHEARFLLGRALLMAGRAEEGQAEIAASTEQKERFLTMSKLHLEAMDSPPNEGVRLKLGELAEALGRPRVAMTWYRAVLGLAPDNERARAALDRLVK